MPFVDTCMLMVNALIFRLGLGQGNKVRCEQALSGTNWNLEHAASALLEDPSLR